MVKNGFFGPLRLQELKCQLWNYNILNSIYAKWQFLETIMIKKGQ